MKRLLCTLWALPCTLGGLLAVLVGGARIVGVRDGALLCLARPKGLWGRFFTRGHFIASCWGGVIIAASPRWLQDEPTLVHELTHWAQARRWGILFPFAYTIAGLVAWRRLGGDLREGWYTANPFEIEARAAEALVANAPPPTTA